MNMTIEMRFTRTVLAASIAGIFSAPAAWADDDVEQLIRPDSSIEAGLGYVSQDSYRFGRFTGLQRSGIHIIGNIDLNRRDKDGPGYVELNGSNLGLDARSMTLRAGEQGNYGLRIDYDQIPYLYSDSYRTPYDGAGTPQLTQPAGLADAATTTAMTGLATRMKPFNIGTKRQGAGVGFAKQVMSDWDIALNYRRDNKDGTRLTAGAMQVGTGGSRGSVILPEPIDYTTDQYEAVARYNGEKLQMQFGYYASLYSNANTALTWDNLYTGTASPTGRFGLPPDNEFHQLNASASYALSAATRVSGNLSFGRMTQNDLFLPYSTASASLPAVLPGRASLDGKVYTTNASVKLHTRLMPKLSLTGGWRYDDRDNKTAISRFDYINADRNVPGATAAADNAQQRWNMPLDIRKQVLFADLDYHLASATTLKLGYDFHKVDHNYEPTTGDKEHTGKAEVRHRFGETVAAGVNYAYSDRQASGYNGAAPLASTYSPTYLATLVSASTGKTFPWLEAPILRKYFLADRKRDKVGAFTNFSPSERLDLQLAAHYNRDRYPDTAAGIGLTRAAGWAVNFDATLLATDTLSGNFFATLDQYKTDQNGANITTAAIARAAELGTIPAANRAVTVLTDRTLTLGLGMRYKPRRSYEVGGNLTHSDSQGRSQVAAGSAVPVAPFTDLESRLNRAELYGKYFLQKDLTLNLRYAYERYSAADWAWDAPLTLTSVTSVVGTGMTSPKYNVHFVGVSLAYQF